LRSTWPAVEQKTGIWKGKRLDETIKETLLGQFRAYLDGFDQDEEERPEEAGEEADLFSVFVELAGLRNEVRTESRLVKDALDQFRGVFDTLQASHAAMEAELRRARAETREHGRVVLRPLLLDILDLRDRLAAGLKSGGAAAHQPRWFERFRLKAKPEAEPWREGLSMTLGRLDRLLADRRIVAIDTVGRPFDPRLARAVASIQDPLAGEGIVVEELRPGFLWEDELLRTAEVTVAKGGAGKGDKT
jgi:molecular chaperone GrpE